MFVLPPSAEVLVERLAGRNTEPPAVIRERITRAADELAAVAEYDYAIVNEDLVLAVAQVAAILDAEARRVSRQDGAATRSSSGCGGTCIDDRVANRSRLT